MTNNLLNLGRNQALVAMRGLNSHQPKRFLNEAIKKKQEHFQLGHDTPVYLKGGFADKFLVQITAILCVIGVADGMYTLSRMAFKK